MTETYTIKPLEWVEDGDGLGFSAPTILGLDACVWIGSSGDYWIGRLFGGGTLRRPSPDEAKKEVERTYRHILKQALEPVNV